MVESTGKILSKGFETYTKNLNLTVPFILNFFITILLAAFILGLGFFYIFGTDLESLQGAASPEELFLLVLEIVKLHIAEIVALMVLYILISMFFQAFFTAGAIGMAQQATETGKSLVSTMMDAGKKNVMNLYLAEILVLLLNLAGIVLLLPGAMKGGITAPSVLLLILGILLWMTYIIILSLVLAVTSYALVIENLGPVDGIIAGFRFFNKHKVDVFVLWIIMGVIVVILTVIGNAMGFVPLMNIIWPFINVLISAFILPPLSTLWWTRLYMTGTDKKIYFNELLARPGEFAANP